MLTNTSTAYSAALWAFAFAGCAPLLLGGSWLAATQSKQILGLTVNCWFLAIVWLTGLLKIAAGLIALSLVQRLGRVFPLRLRRFGTGRIGAVLLFYGGANLAVRALMALLEQPDSMRTPRATWHLVLWDPFSRWAGYSFCAAPSSPRAAQEGR